MHLAHDEEANAQEQQNRQRLVDQELKEAWAFFRLAGEFNAGLQHALGKLRIRHGIGAEFFAILQRAGDNVTCLHDGFDRTLVDARDEVRIGDYVASRGCPAPFENRNKQRQCR